MILFHTLKNYNCIFPPVCVHLRSYLLKRKVKVNVKCWRALCFFLHHQVGLKASIPSCTGRLHTGTHCKMESHAGGTFVLYTSQSLRTCDPSKAIIRNMRNSRCQYYFHDSWLAMSILLFQHPGFPGLGYWHFQKSRPPIFQFHGSKLRKACGEALNKSPNSTRWFSEEISTQYTDNK